MPPRKSTSPAPTRASPAAKASPAAAAKKKASPAPRASKSPARGKKAEPAAAEPEEEPEASSSTTKKSTPVAKAPAASRSPAAAAAQAPDYTSMLVVGAIALLAALLAGAAYYPLEGGAQQKVPTLSAKAFKGMELRPGTYNGSALLAFTLNTTMDSSCAACGDLDALTKSTPFKTQLATWWSADILRVAKIYCNQQPELCERFGIGSDAEGSSPGYPYLTCAARRPRRSVPPATPCTPFRARARVQQHTRHAHSVRAQSSGRDADGCPRHYASGRRWFKGGKEVAAYDGEVSLDGIVKWVAGKQAEGSL